jgi:hypothetical protein
MNVTKMTYHPKSCGNDVSDISFNPNTVKLFNWENPAGSRGIGFELKSATCKLLRWRISSGMSGISATKKIKIVIKNNG